MISLQFLVLFICGLFWGCMLGIIIGVNFIEYFYEEK